MPDRHPNPRIAAAGFLAALLLADAALALPVAEVRKRDFNDNGFIDRGAELEAVRLLLPDLDGTQAVRLGNFDESGAAQMPLDLFDTAPAIQQRQQDCRSGKRFVLQEDVSQISLYHPEAVVPSKNGASFSISRDHVNDLTSWQVSGALAWVPRGWVNRCVLADQTERSSNAQVSGYGFAPFLSFQGTGNSNAQDKSDLSVGVIAQLQLFGGVFDLQELTLAPYYRTDFQGKAEIYGIKASWKPYHFTSRLNGLQGDVGKRAFDWTLGVDVEYLKVKEAGNSGLSDDTDYGYIGANLGVGYTLADVGPHGLRLSVGVDAYRDVLNDFGAINYNAALKFQLTADKRTSLELRYEHGTDRNTLQEVDGVTVNLRLAF